MFIYEDYPASVQHYRHLRACGKSLTGKILQAGQKLNSDMLQAARKLGMPMKGRTLIFDSDADLDTLWDFYLHDFRPRGKCLVDCCQPPGTALSADEEAMLRAHREARSSLFELNDGDASTCEVYLGDLIDPQQPEISLTDINLSQTAGTRSGNLMFCRVVNCQGISMSSGNFFMFRPQHRDFLLQGYARNVKNLPEAKQAEAAFVFFFHRHRQLGEPRAYADVI